MANPQSRDLIQNSVCVLYPVLAVRSSHSINCLIDRGDRLSKATMDEQLQQIARSDHDFRSGLTGLGSNSAVENIPFVPESIDSVMPPPASNAMRRIVRSLSG